MMATIDYLLEPFLTQFYLLEAVCADYITDKEREDIFRELARVFCLAETDELREYYSESALEHFKSINDYASYERFCRTVEFAQKSGQDVGITARDRVILAQKREAMTIKEEILRKGKNLTKEGVTSALLSTALNGNVDAMTTLAYMEYHGICVCKDEHNAIKRLRLCANWNNIFGNLMGIVYDRENKQKYYNNLSAILRSASQKQTFCHIVEFSGRAKRIKEDPTARILERAFGLGIVKRNLYDQVFARVAFSKLISVEDKKKLLLNKQQGAIAALSDIPFDVNTDSDICFDESCFEASPLKREDEARRIAQNIKVAKLCSPDVYKPLLIVANDEYVADEYTDILTDGLAGTCVVEIDAGTLTAQDFFGTKENIFLRGLSETKSARTVFVFKDCEELGSSQCDELIKVLDYEYRRKFKLFEPAVSLDLSAILLIFIASKRNQQVARLCEYCDTVWAEKIRDDEKNGVIDSVFECCLQSFRCIDMTMEDGCLEFLSGFEAKQIKKLIDGALRNAVFGDSRVITLSMLKEACKDHSITVTRREFGYTGGNYNA